MNNEDKKQQLTVSTLSLLGFSLTALIYFANALYLYVGNDAENAAMNVALGVMFFCIGLSFVAIKPK